MHLLLVFMRRVEGRCTYEGEYCLDIVRLKALSGITVGRFDLMLL